MKERLAIKGEKGLCPLLRQQRLSLSALI